MECKKNNHLWIIIILALILVLNILSFFKKDSAIYLETLKVGGPENMEMVKQLYKSETYVSQQTMAIEQALSQINMMNNMTEEQINQMMMDQMMEEQMMLDVDFDEEDFVAQE